MKRLLASALLLAFIPAVMSVSAKPQAKDDIAKLSLKVGDTAPDFTMLSDQWKTVKLSDYRGKQNVLLAVYVLAFTGG
jgi:peroxiredoxin